MMNGLRRILHRIDVVSEWSGKVLCYLLVVMGLITFLEVVSRYVFKDPTRWAFETVQLMFGVYFMLGGAYALFMRAHVNMDLLHSRWSPKTRAIVDVFTSLIFYFFIGCLLYFGGKFAWNSLIVFQRSGTVWAPYIWPAKLAIPVGAFLVLLQGTAKFIRDLNKAITGKEL